MTVFVASELREIQGSLLEIINELGHDPEVLALEITKTLAKAPKCVEWEEGEPGWALVMAFARTCDQLDAKREREI